MPENLYLEFDAFLRSIKQNLDGSFGVLLGAGASISSGIQSANDCIWDWKFLIYQSLSGNLWGIERSGFFNDRGKWAKGFENQRV